MEVSELDDALKVVHSSVSQIKWKLKPAAKRRLDIDILALCTGLRPVVMIDYGGKMPELQERLCTVFQLSQKESLVLQPLRVMVIEDMIYLIHVGGLAEFVESSLNSEIKIHFVDLQQDPPKMVIQTEQNLVATELKEIQKFFLSVFSVDGTNKDLLPCAREVHPVDGKSPVGGVIASQCSEFIDLSDCMQDTHVTVPTLNGWLLGYPVVYLFDRDHIADAIYNLSTKSLRLFKVSVCRNGISGKGSHQEELMSFSVPYDLSMGGKNESWADDFLAHLLMKFEKCKHAWRDLQMDVSECYPQAIVL
ncbi:uncharacterized protein LOC122646674 [Telopea speciosissima]|uniref:uncharacterized protein LOC122646674 n=1 Tax=Telopea speciosissima TaxID=54955 RepID=UPI001CC59B28|nr:uncharacterized protein LOC122646674 [Telopea speciosissima]